MPLTHTRTFRVRHYECDAYGHLNNANYLRYMQETAFDASAAAGYDLERYNKLGHHNCCESGDQRQTNLMQHTFISPISSGRSLGACPGPARRHI